MIDSINFVKGAVAKKDFVPNLTHFQICDGFIKGYNGEMAICSPISCDLNMTPHAGQFLQAITSCEDTVALSRTKSGKLSVSSSNFRFALYNLLVRMRLNSFIHSTQYIEQLLYTKCAKSQSKRFLLI